MKKQRKEGDERCFFAFPTEKTQTPEETYSERPARKGGKPVGQCSV